MAPLLRGSATSLPSVTPSSSTAPTGLPNYNHRFWSCIECVCVCVCMCVRAHLYKKSISLRLTAVSSYSDTKMRICFCRGNGGNGLLRALMWCGEQERQVNAQQPPLVSAFFQGNRPVQSLESALRALRADKALKALPQLVELATKGGEGLPGNWHAQRQQKVGGVHSSPAGAFALQAGWRGCIICERV
jgi:hypothetical protein